MAQTKGIAVGRIDVRINHAKLLELDSAVRQALIRVGADAVVHAKRRPRMPVRTGTLQSSIQMRPPERTRGTAWRLLWGSFDVHYALYQEMGFRLRNGRFYPGRRFLRGAAEETYSRFHDYLRNELGWR